METRCIQQLEKGAYLKTQKFPSVDSKEKLRQAFPIGRPLSQRFMMTTYQDLNLWLWINQKMKTSFNSQHACKRYGEVLMEIRDLSSTFPGDVVFGSSIVGNL